MHYLVCNNCGFPNPMKTEHLTFCEQCHKKLSNNYREWVKKNEGSFDDFKSAVGISDDELKQASDSKKSKKPKTKKGQIILVISITLGAMIGSFIGPKLVKSIFSAKEVIDAASWYDFQSDEFHFKILFPEEPVKQVELLDLGTAKMDMTMYSHEPGDSDVNEIYGAAHAQYPMEMVNSSLMNEAELDLFFVNAINGAAANMQGTILATTVKEIEGFPGRETRVEIAGGKAVMTMRFFLVANRLYVLQVGTQNKNAFNKSINFFFDSFELSPSLFEEPQIST